MWEIWFQEYLWCLLRQTIMEDGTLRITNISKADGGRYTCVARNHFGTSSSTGALVVKGIYFFFSGSGYCTFQAGSLKLLLRWEKKFQLKHEIENEIYDHFMFLPAWQTYKSSMLLSAVSNCSCSGVKLTAAFCSCVEGIFCHRHSIWKELLLRFQIWVFK